MKYLILTLFSITASAQNLVEFKFSKPHGVFEFFKATSNIVNSNKLLLKVYNDSKLKNKENNKLIESNKEILKYLPTNFSFKSNTKRRASGRSLLDQFTIQSILSKDIEDFRSRTMGLVPVEIHKNFFERLSELEIIYEKLIWTENIAKMQLYQRGIEQFANKAKFDRLFKSSINFYKGNWPSNTPFIIGLHPIPISKGATLAQSLGSVESVGVLINANDFADRVGVIFHEICHSIYASQSEEFKLYLEGLFSKNKSIYAPFAYQYFNEAMATAIGNGLAYSQAAGNMDTGEWYENDYINKYSKALFEKVRIYFNSQRTIDRYLVDHSIKQFAKIFPKAHLDIENLLAEFTLIANDRKILDDNIAFLKKTFRARSINFFSPINNAETIEGLKASLPAVALILIKTGEERKFEELSKSFSQLRKLLPTVMKSRKSFITTYDSKMFGATIVIKYNSALEIPKAILKLKQLKFLPKNYKMIKL